MLLPGACNDKLHGTDNITLTRMMEDVGCAPTHWKIESALPSCKQRIQYTNIHRKLQDVEEDLPPCWSIERLVTSATGHDCTSEDKDLRLSFYFHDPVYKEVNVLKAYGLQSLVGNAGKINRFMSSL